MERVILPVMAEGEVDFVQRLGEEFISKGYTVKYLPYTQTIKRLCLNHNSSDEIITETLNREIYSSDVDLAEYGIERPRQFVFPQMVYENDYPGPITLLPREAKSNINYRSYILTAKKTITCVENILNDEDIIVQHQGGEIFRRVLRCVAEKRNIDSVWVGFSPISGKCSLYTDESVRWDSFETKNVNIDKKGRKMAQNLIDNVRDSKSLIDSSSNQRSLQENISSKVNKIRKDDVDFFDQSKSWFRNTLHRKMCEKYTSRLCLNEKESRRFIEENNIVYYPIQYSKESRITIRSPAFYNQAWLIEFLSRSLPKDYKLVVKDHPQRLGRLSPLIAQNISTFSTLVHPEVNSHKLIEYSDAIIVVNNTVGYEALMYGKPVVALGDAFYQHPQFTYTPKNINDIGSSVTAAIDSPKLGRDEVLEFAYRILLGSYPGEWWFENRELDAGNEERLANSIEEYIGKIGD